MEFDKFILDGKARINYQDRALSKALLDAAENDLKVFNKIEITDISARKIISNYYDILRSMLDALASLDGYKIYSHEAFTSYLKEIRNQDQISLKFDRLRKIRNSINYYGKIISLNEAEDHKSEILELIRKVKELIETEFRK